MQDLGLSINTKQETKRELVHKLPNLDPLRAVLALLVIISHVPGLSASVGLPSFRAFSILNKGYEAVWVFFTLSGFLIIRLLFREKSLTDDVNVRAFYTRRILRIYPVYYVVLIVGFLIYHLLLPFVGVDFKIEYGLLEGLLYCVLLTPNVLKALYDIGSILQVLWSIGIEEQFYLLIAPVSKWLRSSYFLGVLFCFTVVYFLVYHLEPTGYLNRFNLTFYFFSFGGFLSVAESQGKLKFLYFPLVMRLALYAAFASYFLFGFAELPSRPAKHLISLVLFGLFILNISKEDRFIVRNNTLHYLGKISYGLYMYHMIVLTFVVFVFMKLRALFELSDSLLIVLINVLTISLTVLTAHFSYQYFEKWFLSKKSDFRMPDTSGSAQLHPVKD